MKLVISDAHEGLKAGITRVLSATCQRCRVHFMRNAQAYVPKGQNTVVAATIPRIFLQPDHTAGPQVWRQVVGQLCARWPKLGNCMDDAEHDMLTYMTFPEHNCFMLIEEVQPRLDVGDWKPHRTFTIGPMHPVQLRLVGTDETG